jgi:hypothetical protein
MSLPDLGAALAETLLAGMPAYSETYRNRVGNRIWPLELAPGESDAFSLNG